MIIRIFCALSRASRIQRIRRTFSERNVVITELARGENLEARLRRESCDLVLIEERSLRSRKAMSIAAMRDLPDHPEVIVFAEEEDPEGRARLLAGGALAVVFHGLSEDALRKAMLALLDRRREDAQRRFHHHQLEVTSRLADFISASPAMQEFMRVVRRVVDADSSLLILGETGAGKEHLARAIHAESARAAGPFIAVNCAALPETLLESELFGHVEGAFTGAVRARRGYFELAHHGTVFLDEIGDLPQHLQVKLLRVLQEKQIQPVGAETRIDVDVRLMAATNRDLSAEIRAGRFRSDLYYRLAVVSLTLPPLRERREDIPALVESYVRHFRVRLGRPVRGVRADALELLVRHNWPGNVREFINAIERAVLLSTDGEITPADLPEGMRAAPGAPPPAAGPVALRPDRLLDLAAALPARPWPEVRDSFLAALERRYFGEVLRASGGRVGEAAERAGIDPRSLYATMKRLGLRKEDFKRPAAAPAPPAPASPAPTTVPPS